MEGLSLNSTSLAEKIRGGYMLSETVPFTLDRGRF